MSVEESCHSRIFRCVTCTYDQYCYGIPSHTYSQIYPFIIKTFDNAETWGKKLDVVNVVEDIHLSHVTGPPINSHAYTANSDRSLESIRCRLSHPTSGFHDNLIIETELKKLFDENY